MAGKGIDLPELLADTLKDLDQRQMVIFRARLADTLKFAIRAAADLARSETAHPAPAAQHGPAPKKGH